MSCILISKHHLWQHYGRVIKNSEQVKLQFIKCMFWKNEILKKKHIGNYDQFLHSKKQGYVNEQQQIKNR